MREWIVLVVTLGCSDAKRDAPVPEPSIPHVAEAQALAIHVDRLLDEALARAPPTMGVESLAIIGVRADGRMDPAEGWLKIEWQERMRGDIEKLSADVPCVTLTWSASSGWSEHPATTCKALGPAGVGYATLGLPRCSAGKILDRMSVEARKVPTVSLRYSPKLPFANDKTVLPSIGVWVLGVESATIIPEGVTVAMVRADDDCPHGSGR